MGGREGLLALQRRCAQARDRTADEHAAVTAQRKQRAKPPEGAQRGLTPSFEAALTNDGQSPPRPVNSNQVLEWFRAGWRNLYGETTWVPQTTSEGLSVGERKLACTLLRLYGPDLVQRAVAELCTRFRWWQGIFAQRGHTLVDPPNVKLLWILRGSVFAQVQGVDQTPQTVHWSPGKEPPAKRGKDKGKGDPPKRRNKRGVGEFEERGEIGIGWGR